MNVQDLHNDERADGIAANTGLEHTALFRATTISSEITDSATVRSLMIEVALTQMHCIHLWEHLAIDTGNSSYTLLRALVTAWCQKPSRTFTEESATIQILIQGYIHNNNNTHQIVDKW